jgi:hypothetical protein
MLELSNIKEFVENLRKLKDLTEKEHEAYLELASIGKDSKYIRGYWKGRHAMVSEILKAIETWKMSKYD